MIIIDNTKSLCPICLKTIDADVVNEAGIVYISKTCPSHGFFKFKHPWSNFRDYVTVKSIIPNSNNCSIADGLVFNLNSICDLNCPFCFARANEYQLEEPDLDRIMYTIKDFRGTYLYLCGGEPTLRKDIFSIITAIKNKGYKVGLFTNGKSLVDLDYVKKLKKIGLDLIILQFDTFNNEQYKILRGEALLSIKTRVIDNLKLCHIPLYLFVMLSRGVNIDQIKCIFEYAVQHRDVIKLINFNPVWEIGRTGAHEEMGASEILAEVEKQTNLNFEDFISSTEFSYNLFEILRKITKKGGRKHPQCEMRCYSVVTKTSVVPISRILNLNRLNKSLKKINGVLDENPSFPAKLKILFILLYISLLKDFLKNSLFRQIVLKLIDTFIRKKDFNSLNVVSIIIGTFHTAANIDLNMVDTCNLFSDSKSGNISSCLRQIHFLGDITANKVTVS